MEEQTHDWRRRKKDSFMSAERNSLVVGYEGGKM